MSWFDAIFGGSNLSKNQWMISKEEIHLLVSRFSVSSLTREEELSIEEALDQARLGDGRISLFQIDSALKKLENLRKISENDSVAINHIFKKYFADKK